VYYDSLLFFLILHEIYHLYVAVVWTCLSSECIAEMFHFTGISLKVAENVSNL